MILFIHLNKKRAQFQTGVFIKDEQWDDDAKVVRKTCKEYSSHNLEIKRIEAKLTDIMVRLRLKDIPLTIERLQEEYDKPSYGFDFIDFMDKAIKAREGVDIADSTVRQHTGILSKLKTFQSPILSNEINDELFARYAKYLNKKLKNRQNVVHGNLKTIKSYINIAIGKGLLEPTQAIKNPIKETKGVQVFLSDLELRTMIELYRTKVLSDSLQNVLRWFIFCCVAGPRIDDFRNLKVDNIHKDLLVYVPRKTARTTGIVVTIPLKKLALQLIKDEGPIHVNGRLFNCISEQKMRDYIKVIAKEHCLINKNVIWHSSRHTFATVFLRNNPGNVVALQKLMGHADIKETIRYLHLDNEDIIKAMNFQNKY